MPIYWLRLLALAEIPLLAFLANSATAQCTETALTPSHSAVQDQFGSATSIYGDTLLVGSPFLGPPSTAGLGAAFVFERDPGGWPEVHPIFPPNEYPNQMFGASVALHGGTLMVQEFLQDPTVAPEGGSAVHVYERQGQVWIHTQRLTEPGYNMPSQPNDFGRSIDLHTDIVYISNRREDKVHVFSRTGGAWTSLETVTAANLLPFVPDPSVAFANRVVADDNTLVIASGAGAGGGPAWILERLNGQWQAVAELDSAPAGGLGPEPAIAIADGFVFVGSELEEGQGGKVYVFKRDAGIWIFHQVLRATPHLTLQRFGNSIGIDDGTLVVGAPGVEVQGTGFAGAAFVFHQSLGQLWEQVEVLTAAAPVQSIRMGSVVCIDQGRASVSATADLLFNQGGQVHIFDAAQPLGFAYGETETNSTGSPASILARGSAYSNHNCLTFQASGLPTGQFGYFLMSLHQGFVPLFGGSQGNLHLDLPIVRFSGDIVLSDSSGEATFEPDLAALPQGTLFQAGETWNFQMWYRDSNPNTTSNTSNGLAITFTTTGLPSVQFPETILRAEEETTQVEVVLTLSQPSEQSVDIAYATSGTAAYNTDWRVEEVNPFTVEAGATSASMTVVIAEDGAIEGDETAIITLIAPVDAILGTASEFTLTIEDDD